MVYSTHSRRQCLYYMYKYREGSTSYKSWVINCSLSVTITVTAFIRRNVHCWRRQGPEGKSFSLHLHSHPFSFIMWASSIINLPSLYFWLDSKACSCKIKSILINCWYWQCIKYDNCQFRHVSTVTTVKVDICQMKTKNNYAKYQLIGY